jgi:plasmid stabilization system protein ParE
MSSYRLTPQAVDDLFEIWSHIASDDPAAADRVEEAVYEACTLLGNTRLAGRIREDLTALPLRFWLVQPYQNYWLCTIRTQNHCKSFGFFTVHAIFPAY